MNEMSEAIVNEPYKLPDGWRWVRLGEVCEIDSNQILPNAEDARRLPYIGLEHVESGTGRILGQINDENGKLIQSITFRFDSRHVLYGKLRPYLNKVVTPDFEGRCSTELLPLIPKNGCDRYYLAWLLRRSETVEEAMRHKTGTRMPRADMDDLFKMIVPFPPLPEQRRIASKIQDLMQEVERARTACEEQLEAAKALPSAYLREIFESEEAKKWERKRLGEVCEKITDGTHKTPEYLSKGIPFISTNNLIPFSDNFDFSQYQKFISPEEHRYLTQRCKPEKGDLLVSKCGTIGKTQVVRVNYEFSIFVGLALLKLKKNIVLPDFLEQLLNHKPMIRNMELKSPGSTRKTLTIKEIATLQISLPPLEIQQCIASELKEKMAYAERLRTSIEKQLEAINTLPQAILRKAFRGEL